MSAFIPSNGSSFFLRNRSVNTKCPYRRHHSIISAKNDTPPGSPNYETNWETLGKGYQSKGLQRIEFIVRPGGKIEEKITGVKGKACEQISEKINEALGQVTSTEKTSEYYEQAYDQVTDSNTVQNEVKWTGGQDYKTW